MSPRHIRNLTFVAFVAVALPQPLFAGTAYVPVAANHQVDGVNFETVMWVSNGGTASGSFSTRFIPTNSDGTPSEEGSGGSQLELIPDGTFFLRGLAPQGAIGMLEITTNPGLVVVARLVGTPAGGVESLGANLPLVASDNLVPANGVAELQGLERTLGETRSNLGVVNLGGVAGACAISAFRANGVKIQQTATVQVPAFGHRQFDDALAILGESAVSHVRATVSCDQAFFAYATIYDVVTGEVVFVGPSSEPDLQGGTEPPPPGIVRFSEPGVFHAPQPGNAVRRLTFAVPPGRYIAARAQLDVFVGPWAPSRSAGSHNIFWMVRDARNGHMFGYVNVTGPNNNTLWFRHGFHPFSSPRFSTPLVLVPGGTYHFDYLYDAAGDRIELSVRTSTGAEIARLTGNPNVSFVDFNPGQTVVMDFGFQPGANPNEPPTFGWQYRNLVVDLTPQEP